MTPPMRSSTMNAKSRPNSLATVTFSGSGPLSSLRLSCVQSFGFGWSFVLFVWLALKSHLAAEVRRRIRAGDQLLERVAAVEELRRVGVPDRERPRAEGVQLFEVRVAVGIAVECVTFSRPSTALFFKERRRRRIGNAAESSVKEPTRDGFGVRRREARRHSRTSPSLAVIRYVLPFTCERRDAVRLIHAEHRPRRDVVGVTVPIARIQALTGLVVLEAQPDEPA